MKNKRLLLLALLLLSSSVLSGCNFKQRVIIFTAAYEDRATYIYDELAKKFPQYNIIMQTFGTGNLTAKLLADQKDVDCDIFYDLEATNTELLIGECDDIFYDLSEFNFDIYTEENLEYTSRHKYYAIDSKIYNGFLINKKVFSDKNLEIPTTYSDFLDEKYKELFVFSNPKSSGTSYCFYNAIISTYGEEEGLKFFDELNKNVKEYPASGSAPLKSTARGDTGMGMCLLWQCVEYANKDDNLTFILPEDTVPYNLYVMGVINKRNIKPATLEVFDYLYNELNPKACPTFSPDILYKNQGEPDEKFKNYPTNIKSMKMDGFFDYERKQNLLDKWKY